MVPSVVSLFKSPEETKAENPDESDGLIESSALGKRLGFGQEQKQPAKISRKETSGKPRFGCSLAWAAESSPVVLKSAELEESSRIRTVGVTLATSAVDGTPVSAKRPRENDDRVDSLIDEVESCLQNENLKRVSNLMNWHRIEH